MPFKIVQVQTVRGNPVLRAVPFNWEKNGILHWPPENPEQLRRIEHSEPEDTWSALKCTVKKTNLISFHNAEYLLVKMRSATEFGHNGNYSPSPKIQSVVRSNNEDSTLLKAQEKATPGNSFDKNLRAMDAKVDNMMQMLTTFQKNQNKMLYNQRTILLKLSEISNHLEEISRQPSWPTENAIGSDNILGFDIKSIENIEDMKNFESMLENPIIETELYKKFSVICGVGKGQGINNAYTLSDIMFNRDFLNNCSWSGGSRTETPKNCFKSYNNFLNFFFKLVHESDKNFTMLDCEMFFKNILRNSRKRSESQRIRKSTTRRRAKKIRLLNHEMQKVLLEEEEEEQ